MPVSDDHALRQFEIEALRQINRSLEKFNDKLEGIDDRLIRIESNKLEPAVEVLKKDVAALQADKFRRDGALGLTAWIFRNWPAVIGYVGLIYTVLKATRQI